MEDYCGDFEVDPVGGLGGDEFITHSFEEGTNWYGDEHVEHWLDELPKQVKHEGEQSMHYAFWVE